MNKITRVILLSVSILGCYSDGKYKYCEWAIYQGGIVIAKQYILYRQFVSCNSANSKVGFGGGSTYKMLVVDKIVSKETAAKIKKDNAN